MSSQHQAWVKVSHRQQVLPHVLPVCIYQTHAATRRHAWRSAGVHGLSRSVSDPENSKHRIASEMRPETSCQVTHPPVPNEPINRIAESFSLQLQSNWLIAVWRLHFEGHRSEDVSISITNTPGKEGRIHSDLTCSRLALMPNGRLLFVRTADKKKKKVLDRCAWKL